MIGYVTFGCADKEKAAAYFDAILAPIGAVRAMELERGYAWTTPESGGAGMFVANTPYDANDPTPGNGAMVAINCGDRDKVDAVYKLALEHGGSDEGPPGYRMGNFYGAYFRDPDGNKFAAFCMQAPDA